MDSRSGSGTASGSGIAGRNQSWKHCTLVEETEMTQFVTIIAC